MLALAGVWRPRSYCHLKVAECSLENHGPRAQGHLNRKSEYGMRSTIDIRRLARREPPQKFPDGPFRWALELAVGSCKVVGTAGVSWQR